MKLLVVLTTYKRNSKILRLINSFNDPLFYSIKDFIDIIIADDDPNSILGTLINELNENHVFPLIYIKNSKNLGQGKNAAFTIYDNFSYDYYWMPGDDDIIIVNEFKELINKVFLLKPDIALLEFRQGANLEGGTFFEGESRLITEYDECIEKIMRFGKNTSTIFKRPSNWMMEEVLTTFSECMYQDKVLAILVYLESIKKEVYLKTEITATGDKDFGRLRYSMRVFANLPLAVSLAIKIYNNKYLTNYNFIQNSKTSVFWWWKFGLLAHFNRSSQLAYTNSRLISEIFYPLTYLIRKISGREQSYFEKS